jgi:hypothetical protein
LDKYWLPKVLRRFISFSYKLYEIRYIKKFDYLLSVSEIIVNRFKNYNSRTSIITNYPLLHEFTVNAESKREQAICFAGTINKEYNHYLIMDALEKCNGVYYFLAGSGGYLNYLKS